MATPGYHRTGEAAGGQYIVRPILPATRVHLLAGSSGSGKTTLALQLVDAVRAGRRFLSHQVSSVDCAFVSLERAADEVRLTMERVGVDLPQAALLSGVDEPRLNCLGGLLGAIPPTTGFLVIDGFQTLTPRGKMNDYQPVHEFLTGAAAVCKKRGLTVLGTCHATKLRNDERFRNPRERILGSAGWAAFCSTVLILDAGDPDKVGDLYRRLWVLPRNARAVSYEFRLDDRGRFPGISTTGTEWLDLKLSQVRPGADVTTRDVMAWAREVGLPERTAEQWLTDQIRGVVRLQRTTRGVYRRTPGFISNDLDDFLGPERVV